MKKLIYGGLFLALVGIGFMACKKESMSPMDNAKSVNNVTTAQKQKGELAQSNEKSTGNDGLDSMAQAANIARIKYESGDEFTVDSYDDNNVYTIHMQEFYLDSIVKFVIDDGSQNYGVEIDWSTKSIDIDGVGVFSFSNYYGSNGLTRTSGMLKNITAVFTPYFALFGKVTNTWNHNGNGDTFHPAGIFWGSVEKSRSPCDKILHRQSVTYQDYAFWIRVGTHTEYGVPC